MTYQLKFRVPPSITRLPTVIYRSGAHEHYQARKKLYEKYGEARFLQEGGSQGEALRSASFFGTNGRNTWLQRACMFVHVLMDVIDGRITIAYDLDSFPAKMDHAQKCEVLMKGSDHAMALFMDEVDNLVDEEATRAFAPELYSK
jgi:hypothetical protein